MPVVETVTAAGFANVTRRYGLNRSYLKGDECQQVWTEWVIVAYNSDTLAIRTSENTSTADSIRADPLTTNGRAKPSRGRFVSKEFFDSK